MHKISKKIHQWLMLIIGVQCVIWSLSGVYMVVADIDYIHGDALIKNQQISIDTSTTNLQLNDFYQQYSQAQQVRLGMFLGKPVYRFIDDKQLTMISAETGQLLSPITQQQARLIAQSEYVDNGHIVAVHFIGDNAPPELSARYLPVWQIDFDGFIDPTLYVSANHGEIVTKRHALWRLFDWMFRFHVMDYQHSEVDNQLLFWSALLALIASLSGGVLVYYRVVLPIIKR